MLAWDVIFDIRKTGVLSVFSLFLTGVKVYVGVCVCIRTHTHKLHVGYCDVSPGVGTRHLDSPKNPSGLKLGIYLSMGKTIVLWAGPRLIIEIIHFLRDDVKLASLVRAQDCQSRGRQFDSSQKFNIEKSIDFSMLK